MTQMVPVPRLSVVVAALTAACIATLGIAPQPAQADVDYVFNVNCGLSHLGSDDPIVSPDQPGNSHRHAFYGNAGTDAFSTTRSLLGSESTCERGFGSADHSAYWVPSLYRRLPGGKLQEVRLSSDDQYLSAYYRRTGGSTGDKVKPFPPGLRMIAGNAFARKPQSTLDVAWRCNGGQGGAFVATIPNCSGGSLLQAFVFFPDCWDGVNLDSADHRSHMTVSEWAHGRCPKTHPVKLPQLTLELSFRLPRVTGATYELSSGGQYSLHGDFFAAWDDKVQSALVNQCLNGGRYCENIDRSAVDLAKAGPVMRGREPARPSPSPSITTAPADHGDHALGASPGASPSTLRAVAEESNSPAAGVLGGVGAAAIVVVASALVYVRRRQRHAAGRARG